MINTISCQDNLELMHGMSAGFVDLIYLDPPFNSKRNYSTPTGSFKDTWSSVNISDEQDIAFSSPHIFNLINLFQQSSMYSYLIYMTVRLQEMYRVLKDTGSIYLHCDQSASHYLKIIMDMIFGAKNFRNEIIWKRTTNKKTTKKFPVVHDTILFYVKSNNAQFKNIYIEYDEEYIRKFFPYEDENGRYGVSPLTGPGIVKTGESGHEWCGINPSTVGRGRHWAVPQNIPDHVQLPDNWNSMNTQDRLDLLDSAGLIRWSNKLVGSPQFKKYLSTLQGVIITDTMVDINNRQSDNTNYPTQKPVELLERIIKASSNEGDLVFDPFCGSGTTLFAAEKLGRNWIGCDVSEEAVKICQQRL